MSASATQGGDNKHPFNGLFSTTTWVSRHHKFKPIWILMKQETMGWGGGMSWTICKSFAPRSRQTTTPASHHSLSYRPDALPDAQPTVSKQQTCKQRMSSLPSLSPKSRTLIPGQQSSIIAAKSLTCAADQLQTCM